MNAQWIPIQWIKEIKSYFFILYNDMAKLYLYVFYEDWRKITKASCLPWCYVYIEWLRIGQRGNTEAYISAVFVVFVLS